MPDNEAMCTVGICNSRQLAVLQQVDDLEDLAAPIYVGDRWAGAGWAGLGWEVGSPDAAMH